MSMKKLKKLLQTAQQGKILREGIIYSDYRYDQMLENLRY